MGYFLGGNEGRELLGVGDVALYWCQEVSSIGACSYWATNRKKGTVNLSTEPLTPAHESALSKGLNLAPAPRTIPTV